MPLFCIIMDSGMGRGWIIGSVVLLVVAAVAGYLLESDSAEARTVLPLVEGCQLEQSVCSVTLPNGAELQFEMSPKPLPTAEPIQMRALLSGIEQMPERIEVLFEGKDMYMGFLQYRLKPDAEAGIYRGKGSLSICTRRLMEWIARVRIRYREETIEIPFSFETLHP